VFSVSLLAGAVGNTGRVIAFEPNPINYAELTRNLALNHFVHVTTFPVALGREPGNLPLTFASSLLSAGTLLPQMHPFVATAKDRDTVQVEVIRLDDLAFRMSLPMPDLVKIDVEGFETEVLMGMRGVLASRPRLFIEIHGADPDAKLANAQAVGELLGSAGYSTVFFVELGMSVNLST